MNNEEEKNSDMKKEKISQWEKNVTGKHPLLSQLGLTIVGGIIAGIIVTWWAANNIPPKPKADSVATSSSSAEVTIQNFGYIPANKVYEIATSDQVTVAPIFNIERGEKYIKLEDTEQQNVKRAIIKELPRSEVIQINIYGSNKIAINNK